MARHSFRFRRVSDETIELCQRLRRTLENLPDEDRRELLEDLGEVEKLATGAEDPPLSLAFIGQYNAGKSTLIRALTDREDIPIDADVCTDTVTAYNWRGIRLLDTPGVRAGYPDHDERTARCVGQADLLLFVITPELFDDTVGTYFRGLAFDENRAPEMMLVVNKMNMTPGKPEVLGPDIERVTAPLSLEELRTVFVDASAHLEAQSEEDPGSREELLAISNLGALEEAIDQFVTDSGLWGRLTAPLHALRGIAHRAAGLAHAEKPEERVHVLKLGRALRELDRSEQRLRSKFEALLSETQADIAEIGDGLAEKLTAGRSREEAEEAMGKAKEELRRCAERLESNAVKAFEQELSNLASRLEHIKPSDLSRAVVRYLPGDVDSSMDVAVGDAGAAADPGRYAGVITRVEDVGQILSRLAAGPRAAELPGRLVASSDSWAHSAVKQIGSLLGHRFRPWEAVKWAYWIGRVGKVLSKAGPILAIVATLLAGHQRNCEERKLAEYRSQIRTYYHQIAADLAGTFAQWRDTLLSSAYDPWRAALAEQMQVITEATKRGTDTEDELAAIIERSGQLLEELHEQVSLDREGRPRS